MSNFTRRAALLGGGAVIGAALARRYGSGIPSTAGTESIAPEGAAHTLNDASGLSETPVFSHVTVPQNNTLVDALRGEIKAARAGNRPFNIGAARHSMGGQAIPRQGHAVTLDGGEIELDSDKGVMRVHAGVRWDQVIQTLDPLGWGPAVMQSNNDFGVAATFCVNAHGWPVPYGPMGATVRGFSMLTAEGDLIDVTRDSARDVFNMTMGGYGLTGAITHMDVDVVRNQRLTPSFEEMPAEEFGTRFRAAVDQPDVTMAYGRLNVARDDFMSRALMITYRPTDNQEDLPAASGSGFMSKAARVVYRAQLHNERMKRLRWWTEADLGPMLGSGEVTRNSLINEPVITLDDRDPTRTDILHEYFVPFDRFPDFLTVCRDIIPASYQEFLNVTLRFVNTDADSYLSYASVPRIAAVMSFSQEFTARAEADMARMTQQLIDGITGIGGSYYLPYRPHARLEQFTKAYPRAAEFAAAKRGLDPSLTFRNALWDTYLEPL